MRELSGEDINAQKCNLLCALIAHIYVAIIKDRY